MEARHRSRGRSGYLLPRGLGLLAIAWVALLAILVSPGGAEPVHAAPGGGSGGNGAGQSPTFNDPQCDETTGQLSDATIHLPNASANGHWELNGDDVGRDQGVHTMSPGDDVTVARVGSNGDVVNSWTHTFDDPECEAPENGENGNGENGNGENGNGENGNGENGNGGNGNGGNGENGENGENGNGGNGNGGNGENGENGNGGSSPPPAPQPETQATPEPTAEPTPEATPEPTAEPTPEATPEPQPEILGASAELSKTATDDVAVVGELVTFYVALTVTADTTVENIGILDTFEHAYLEYVSGSEDCVLLPASMPGLSQVACDAGTVELGQPGEPESQTFTFELTFRAVETTLPGTTENLVEGFFDGNRIGPVSATVEVIEIAGLELPEAGDGSFMAANGSSTLPAGLLLLGLLVGGAGAGLVARSLARRSRGGSK